MPRWVRMSAAMAFVVAIGCSSTTPPAAKQTPDAKPDVTNKAGRGGDAAPPPKPPPP